MRENGLTKCMCARCGSVWYSCEGCEECPHCLAPQEPRRPWASRVCEAVHDATFLRRLHGWATVFWFVASVPICLWLQRSIEFLVFISVYAVVMGHWSSWQSARVEVKQDEATCPSEGTVDANH